MVSLRKLCSLGSSATIEDKPDIARLRAAFGEGPADALATILELKNGFYVFNQALHVFSDAGTANEPSIVEWNGRSCWKNRYGELARIGTCFAQDAFGNQFCWDNGTVSLFDADTAVYTLVAPSIDEWARLVLEDPDRWVHRGACESWQATNGHLLPGHRLVARVSRLVGGTYSGKNAAVEEVVGGMRYKGMRRLGLQMHPRSRVHWSPE